MGTINGIGTRFMNFSDPSNDNSVFVTKWFTFIFLPIIPLSRSKIIRNSTIASATFKYEILTEEKVILKEVLSTYFWSLLILPIWLLGPILALDQMHIFDSKSEGTIIGSVFFYGTWLIFWILKIKKWDDQRGLTRDKQTSFLYKIFKN